MSPLLALGALAAALVLFVAVAAITAHLEYRRRFPPARGVELDHMGRCLDCERMPRENDRRYRRRLRDRLTRR